VTPRSRRSASSPPEPASRVSRSRQSKELAQLRAAVIDNSLFEPTTLGEAIERLGFVQADPIRAPARAQDLILRHRVIDYRAGDLERLYPSLDLDEDRIYAYGVIPAATRALLHPRGLPAPRGLERRILEFVQRNGSTHPDELARRFGPRRRTNVWGGQSRATTYALMRLHYNGLLRIARRDAGVRVYEASPEPKIALPAEERLARVVMLVARIFSPFPLASLRAMMGQLRYVFPKLPQRHRAITRLRESGELMTGTLHGLEYVWATDTRFPTAGDRLRSVRFLAPFDPVVWDRRRFEHLWGWAYRFEAYTPLAKRARGYYALPLSWGDEVIGWTNIAARDGDMTVDLGFAQTRPRSREFSRALEEEVERMRAFLRPLTSHTAPSTPPSPVRGACAVVLKGSSPHG